MSPEADILVEQAIDLFVRAVSALDFNKAERAAAVAMAASNYVSTDGEST